MFLKFLAWMAIWVIVPFTEKRKKRVGFMEKKKLFCTYKD